VRLDLFFLVSDWRKVNMIPISSTDERVGVMCFMSRCIASLKSREM